MKMSEIVNGAFGIIRFGLAMTCADLHLFCTSSNVLENSDLLLKVKVANYFDQSLFKSQHNKNQRAL